MTTRIAINGFGRIGRLVLRCLEMGWAALTHGRASFVGMTGFGASAPAGELFAHFKITKEAVVAAAKANLA